MEIKRFPVLGGEAVLTAYLQRTAPAIKISGRRPAVLILPGGGYEHVSDAESEPVALAYSAKGYAAFVLAYSVLKGTVFPRPQAEGLAALAFIRKNCEQFCVDKDRVFVVGFSAGGHLAGSLGVHWNNADIQRAAGVSGAEGRPDGLILVYPCITAGEYAYPGIPSRHGKNLNAEQMKLLSLENFVGPHTPPCYLCHCATDTVVPAMNSLLFASALARQNVRYELRIFAEGPHGFSLCTAATAPDMSAHEGEAGFEFLTDAKLLARFRQTAKKLSGWLDESVAFLDSL